MLKKIEIRNLTELNNAMYAGAAYVTELVGTNKLPKTKNGNLVVEMVLEGS